MSVFCAHCDGRPDMGHDRDCPVWMKQEAERELKVLVERDNHWRSLVMSATTLIRTESAWAWTGIVLAHRYAERSFVEYLDREWKMEELWGYKLGDGVEVCTTSSAHRKAGVTPRWELATVSSFSVAGGVRILNVTLVNDKTQVRPVKLPNEIRRWEKPSTPEDIERFLTGGQ